MVGQFGRRQLVHCCFLFCQQDGEECLSFRIPLPLFASFQMKYCDRVTLFPQEFGLIKNTLAAYADT
jgi:hypothetical protein